MHRLERVRILVLGGTQFLGRHVVEAALSRGHDVTLFNRGQTRPELFPEVEKLRGDRDGDLGALQGRSFDAVVDTSGYVPRIVSATLDALGESATTRSSRASPSTTISRRRRPRRARSRSSRSRARSGASITAR